MVLISMNNTKNIHRTSIHGTITLLSLPEELNYLISENNGIFPKHIFPIAMYPHIAQILDSRGIDYLSIEDFYDPLDFIKKASSNLKIIELLAHLFDKKMDLKFEDLCRNKLFSNSPFIILLKIFNDSIFNKIYTLKKMCEAIQPAHIVAFDNNKDILFNDIKFNIGTLSLDTLLLIKNKYQYNLEYYTIKKELIFSKYIRNFVKYLFNDILKYLINCINIKNELPNVAIGRSNTLADIPSYLTEWRKSRGNVINISNVMDNNINHKNKKSWQILKQIGITKKTLNEFWNEIILDNEIKQLFEYDGINYFNIILKWLKIYIFEIIPKTILKSIDIEKLFIKKKIGIFLNPSIADYKEIAASLAAQRIGINICTIQHGAMGSVEAPIIKYSDYVNYKYSYVYGNGVCNYFKREMKDNEKYAIPIATGNPILQQLYLNQRKTIKINKEKRKISVLYVDTHFIPDFFYYGWNSYPNFWYINLQKKMVMLFNNFKDITFNIKQYPYQPFIHPLREFCSEKKLNNIKFLPNNVDTENYLESNDLYIIDFPMTSLLKMLCTRKPIIVYYNKYCLKMIKEAKNLLKKRVELCENEHEYFTTIEKYCNNIDLINEVIEPNDEFLHQYGIHSKEPADKIVFNNILKIT